MLIIIDAINRDSSILLLSKGKEDKGLEDSLFLTVPCVPLRRVFPPVNPSPAFPQHHVDPAIGVYIIDRFTYYALEFLERVTPSSEHTLKQFVSQSHSSGVVGMFAHINASQLFSCASCSHCLWDLRRNKYIAAVLMCQL